MRVLALLLISLLSVNAADLSSPDRLWVRELIAPAFDLDQLRHKYLDDRSVSPEIKRAIEQRVVMTGMCPVEAVAAAGLPLHGVMYNHHTPVEGLGITIAKQCDHPEKESGVELTFRNATQFGREVVFRVCFWEGRAVVIDQNKLVPPCWEQDNDNGWGQ
jgi:hypothetical protein